MLMHDDDDDDDDDDDGNALVTAVTLRCPTS
jgi:hypothetical protein